MRILKAKTVFLKISEKSSFFSPAGRKTHSKTETAMKVWVKNMLKSVMINDSMNYRTGNELSMVELHYKELSIIH